MILVNDNSVDSINTALLKLKEEINLKSNNPRSEFKTDINSAYIGVCNSDAPNRKKTVVFDKANNIEIKKGLIIGVFFKYNNNSKRPYIVINNNNYEIRVNGKMCSYGAWLNNSYHTLIFDGQFFELLDNGGIIEQTDKYKIYSDNYIEAYGLWTCQNLVLPYRTNLKTVQATSIYNGAITYPVNITLQTEYTILFRYSNNIRADVSIQYYYTGYVLEKIGL